MDQHINHNHIYPHTTLCFTKTPQFIQSYRLAIHLSPWHTSHIVWK